jgi:chromosome segregation ATPase
MEKIEDVFKEAEEAARSEYRRHNHLPGEITVSKQSVVALNDKIKELEAKVEEYKAYCLSWQKSAKENNERANELEKKMEDLRNFWKPMIDKFETKFPNAGNANTLALTALTESFAIHCENETINEKLKVAVEALEFYGDAKNWRMSEMCSLVSDSILKDDIENSWRTSGGKRAREALKVIK